MTESIYIPVRFPGMNEMISAANSSRYKYNNLKTEFTEVAAWHMKAAKLSKRDQVFLNIAWYESLQSRRDPDNVAAAKKFILDGLKNAGVILNDTRKIILGWREIVVYGQDKKEGVEVRLI